MHKTLKAETARPPRRTLATQQRRFDWFRDRYNTERPHEALGRRDETTGRIVDHLGRPARREGGNHKGKCYQSADNKVSLSSELFTSSESWASVADKTSIRNIAAVPRERVGW